MLQRHFLPWAVSFTDTKPLKATTAPQPHPHRHPQASVEPERNRKKRWGRRKRLHYLYCCHGATAGEDLALLGGVRSPVPGQDVHERGLAGPRRAHDGHQLPAVELPGNAFQEGLVPCKTAEDVHFPTTAGPAGLIPGAAQTRVWCTSAPGTPGHGTQARGPIRL